MPTRPIVNDALWRCLCPSFGQGQRGLGRRGFLRHQSRLVLASPTARSYNASHTHSHTDVLPQVAPSQSTRPASSSDQQLSHHAWRKAPSLVLLPTLELYDRLRNDAAAGRHESVMQIINILIKDRRERPNARLYAAMLHSFVHPAEGTAGKVRKVLEEMAEAGVDLDAGGCHAVLEALAVHPDYLLREEILAYMKERWFALSVRGHNMVAAGLLRDRLFEQAIQKIEDMAQQRIQVADWLLDKAVWILLDYGEVEEAWQLLLVRLQDGRTVLSHPLWAQFLDVAARSCHAESATYVWKNRVIPGYLKPPTATCLHMLNMAARSGNVEIATDVFRVLAERDTVLSSYHYEMLLEAYLKASDLNAAISVLIIMVEAGIKVDEASIHPLFTYLKQDEARPMQAFDILQNSESAGKKVPTAAINACLHASVQLNRLEEAVEIYKALHTVSRAGPNTQTFNILFQGCHKAGRKELAMFLASEMVKLGIEPDSLTYDRLVLVCCNANDVHEAFLYYEEMRSSNHVPRRGTFGMLIQSGISHGHVKTPNALEDMKKCGYLPPRAIEEAVRDTFAVLADTPESNGSGAAHQSMGDLATEKVGPGVSESGGHMLEVMSPRG